MIFLKWYTVGLFALSVIFNIEKMLNSQVKKDRIAVFCSLMLYVPAIIYVIKS